MTRNYKKETKKGKLSCKKGDPSDRNVTLQHCEVSKI